MLSEIYRNDRICCGGERFMEEKGMSCATSTTRLLIYPQQSILSVHLHNKTYIEFFSAINKTESKTVREINPPWLTLLNCNISVLIIASDK